METYVLISFRIISIMLLLLFSILFIMGKRPIGELPVFDFLSLIVIGAIVGADIADPNIEHLPTAFAVVFLSIFQRIVSTLVLKSDKIRKLVTFESTIIIKDGKFDYKNLKKINYSIDDILMLLREKDIFDISKVSYGIIESNGNISILKKSQHETVTLEDMNLPFKKSNLALTVILEGELKKENMELLNVTSEDIMIKLNDQGFNNLEEIFYGSMDFQGKLTVSSYKDKFNKIK